MFQLLPNLNAVQTALLFAFCFLTVTWACIVFLTRLRAALVHRGRSANDMIGFSLASFSTMYGILLGLIAVEAYQDFSEVRDSVSKEALSITTLHRDFDAYPEALREHFRDELRLYVTETIQESWPSKDKSIAPGEAVTSRLRKIFNELLSVEPTSKSQEIIHAENLRQINTLMDLRRVRVASSGDGVPNLVWAVLFFGAFIHMALFALFDMERPAHLILGSALALFLGAAVFLIAALDDPFAGGVTIGPDAFENAQKWMRR